jgi:hypothetical protein
MAFFWVVLQKLMEHQEQQARSLDAANPNSWFMTRFWARTAPLVIPASWPLRIMCMASSRQRNPPRDTDHATAC